MQKSGVYSILSAMSKTAVIATGGKQYLVAEGDVISIEKIDAEKKTSFPVLLIDDGTTTTVGTPEVKGAKVEAEIIDEGKGKKLTVIKYRAKSRYFKKRGHRQPYTKVKITKIA